MKNSVYLTQCFILELPDNGTDCSIPSPPTNNDTNCLKCQSVARFLTGGAINDYYSSGAVVCLLLGLVTILVGLSAMIMNYVIVTVIRRQRRGTSFEILLTVLAYTDMFCGLAQAACALCVIIYSRNWSRDLGATTAYMYSLMFAVLARSASSFVTVTIAVERYLMIAFPLQTRQWFTPRNSKILAGAALGLSFILSFIPRVSSQYVGANRLKELQSVSELDYLVYTTPLAKFWYVDFKGSTRIDFWLPLPLLLIFNGIIFYHIRKYSLRRRELSATLKTDLRAGRMFLPIVLILLVCNIPPIIFSYFQHNWQILYMELVMGIFLSAAINSAANLPIYYLKSPGFKEEATLVLLNWFPYLCRPPPAADKSVWCELGPSSSMQTDDVALQQEDASSDEQNDLKLNASVNCYN